MNKIIDSLVQCIKEYKKDKVNELIHPADSIKAISCIKYISLNNKKSIFLVLPKTYPIYKMYIELYSAGNVEYLSNSKKINNLNQNADIFLVNILQYKHFFSVYKGNYEDIFVCNAEFVDREILHDIIHLNGTIWFLTFKNMSFDTQKYILNYKVEDNIIITYNDTNKLIEEYEDTYIPEVDSKSCNDLKYDYNIIKEKLSNSDHKCPICLQIYSFPVFLPCYHIVCKICLENVKKCFECKTEIKKEKCVLFNDQKHTMSLFTYCKNILKNNEDYAVLYVDKQHLNTFKEEIGKYRNIYIYSGTVDELEKIYKDFIENNGILLITENFYEYLDFYNIKYFIMSLDYSLINEDPIPDIINYKINSCLRKPEDKCYFYRNCYYHSPNTLNNKRCVE